MSESITRVYQVENIDEFNEVKEIDNQGQANHDLRQGWSLLGVFPNPNADKRDNCPVVYVLGRRH